VLAQGVWFSHHALVLLVSSVVQDKVSIFVRPGKEGSDGGLPPAFE